MIMIEAVIKPFVLDRVREALAKLGVTNLTECQVSDFGVGLGHHEIYRGAEYSVESVPRVKVQMIVSEALEDRIVAAICKSAQTSARSDGKVFVMPVIKAISIGGASLDRSL